MIVLQIKCAQANGLRAAVGQLIRLIRLGALVIVISVLQTLVMSAVAAENKGAAESSKDTELKPGMLSGVGSLVDETRDKFSDRFSGFVVQIDDFIGSAESDKKLNTSWARIRIDTVKPGAEKAKLVGTVKLRVVLPQSQKRFRLLVSSEDDASSAANSDAAQREQVAGADTGDVALALRFIRTAKDRFRLNYDIGARYKDNKAQIFGRFIAGYKIDSNYGFTNTFTNSFTLFSASGYQNSFLINSHRTLFNRETLYFRNSLEFNWRKDLKGVAIGETIGLYADLGKRRALALEGITGYATALNPGATDRYRGAEIRARFRHSVWRPWFYYEIWPSVSWSSSNNYERAYGGLFRLEVTLGNI